MTGRHVSFPYCDLPLSFVSPDTTEATGGSPDTIPLPVRAPDTIEATARSSRTATTTGFMLIVQLSGQQKKCCSGTLRRYL